MWLYLFVLIAVAVGFHHLSIRNLHVRERRNSSERGGWAMKIDLGDHQRLKKFSKSTKKPPKTSKYEHIGESHAYLHVRFTPVPDAEDLPVVVFESHIGMPANCWGLLEQKLLGVLPTVVYERQGYGLSSPLANSNEPRDIYDICKDLYSMLFEIGLVSTSGENCPKLIFVGHSFGGIIIRAFQCIYRPKNVIDPPPVTMLNKYPTMLPLLAIRLPKVFSTAALLADFGVIRFMDLVFGIKIMPLQVKFISRLEDRDVSAIRAWSYSSRTLKTMSSEMGGYPESLRILESLELEIGNDDIVIETSGSRKEVGPKSQNISTDLNPYLGIIITVVMVEKVEKPVDIKISYEEWKSWWESEQKEVVFRLNDIKNLTGNDALLIDDELDNASLCVSEKVLDAISSICNANRISTLYSKDN
ncbi:hypothetical protein HK096_004788 [Nowakowskiella sp. JEL0078]|nr:hypothetical protein HK096_004788 [Nowakowskiella sp. JEL0078]